MIASGILSLMYLMETPLKKQKTGALLLIFPRVELKLPTLLLMIINLIVERYSGRPKTSGKLLQVLISLIPQRLHLLYLALAILIILGQADC